MNKLQSLLMKIPLHNQVYSTIVHKRINNYFPLREQQNKIIQEINGN